MVFNSFAFALFMPTVFVLYWTLPRRFQNPLLLAASYVFYGAWDWRFGGLLLLSTVVDFFVARRLEIETAQRSRRLLLGTSLVVNLGVLGFFKYFDFFVESAVGLFGRFGLDADGFTLRIILPVGISFYTFQTLAYTIDVFRRKSEVEHNFVTFALYVAFFPQLVAGPIERAQRLIPQLKVPRASLTYQQFRSGAFLILLGLFRKIAIADTLAPYVDEAFTGASTAGAIKLIVGVYAFALQIYGDFAGYTDIARGTARLLGVDLMLNFNAPYLSRNITNFWRTWHMSLSTWLRDYLYIPLGGSREGQLMRNRNLMITMLLGGLWHGAAWTFVVWGGLHGLYLMMHQRLSGRSSKAPSDSFTLGDLAPALVTFNFVCLGWVFFRAESFGQAFDLLRGVVTLRSGSIDKNALALVILLGLTAVAIDLAQRNFASHTVVLRWPAPARGVIYAALLVGVVVFSGAQQVPFIYFQF